MLFWTQRNFEIRGKNALLCDIRACWKRLRGTHFAAFPEAVNCVCCIQRRIYRYFWCTKRPVHRAGSCALQYSDDGKSDYSQRNVSIIPFHGGTMRLFARLLSLRNYVALRPQLFPFPRDAYVWHNTESVAAWIGAFVLCGLWTKADYTGWS